MSYEKLEKFIITIINDDLEAIKMLSEGIDIAQINYKVFETIRNGNPDISKHSKEYLNELACTLCSEATLRYLHSIGMRYYESCFYILYHRDPPNFGKLIDNNPAWFDFKGSYSWYYQNTNTIDENSALFAERILLPAILQLPFIKDENNKSLNFDLICSRIASSSRKISSQIYLLFNQEPPLMDTPNWDKLVKCIKDKFDTQYLKPLQLGVEPVSSSELDKIKAELAGLNEKYAQLENKLAFKEIDHKEMDPSKSQPTFFQS